MRGGGAGAGTAGDGGFAEVEGVLGSEGRAEGMRLEHCINRAVTAVENRVNWRPMWASRLLGCTVGLLRLIEWTVPGSFNCHMDGAPFRLTTRIQIAGVMWRGRYWYDWSRA